MANVLSFDKQVTIIGSLAEGSSIRAIERMTGVHRDTIMRLGVKVGQGCAKIQDAIMRDVDRLTPVNGTVFDGAGWALNRIPAYRYWFLREIVHVLEENGRFEPYRVDTANPPAAVISDYGARVWLSSHPDLRRYFMSHYLPYWRDLWLPGMSAVINPGGRATWTVPAGGDYAIYASASISCANRN